MNYTMKKILMLLLLVNCFVSFTFAEEVRGCTTRRVIYESDEYSCHGSTYNERYGWQVTNHNSFKINVDIMLYAQGGVYYNRYTSIKKDAEVVKTQSIILKPNESYIFKREEHCSTKVNCSCDDYPISNYYIEYKAYKL